MIYFYNSSIKYLSMTIAKPRVFIVQEHEDANLVLNGLFWLKGCESHTFTNGKDCLEKMSQLEGKVDVIIMGGDIASDRNLTLIINIKKININTKVLVIADEDSDKTRILGYGADEFSLKPISPENIGDKVLMLISRGTVREKR
jgi:DNA-binding NtrC family response regulator